MTGRNRRMNRRKRTRRNMDRKNEKGRTGGE
jgi:hypothetical protein